MSQYSWTYQSRFERSSQWYVVAATIIITGVLVSFLVGEYLLGIVLILFCGVYLLYDINAHPTVNVTLGDTGIDLNGMLYPYDRVESFRIVRVENTPLIMRFRMKSRTIGMMDIYLDPSIDINELRLYLGNSLPEDEPTDMTTMERFLLSLRL